MTLQMETKILSSSRSDVELRLSVDVVLFTLIADKLHVLLRRRDWEPFAGVLALIGVINPSGEQLKDTMLRELYRIGLGDIWIEQLKTFDRPPQYVDGAITRQGRDPRGRVLSVAYVGLVPPAQHNVVATNDELVWVPVDDLSPLAFDHEEITHYALWRLRNKILYSPIAFQLLSDQFTLTQLQRAYEMVLGEQLDKRNFRRKVLDSGVVVETDHFTQQGTRRPARLYRFAERHFEFR